jgi:hypothetical protein
LERFSEICHIKPAEVFMFGYRSLVRRNRRVHKFGRSTRPLRLEMLERRDQPATLSVLPALHQTAIEPSIDVRALAGLTPAMIRHAYGFDAANVANTPGDGSGQTIAIVTAFADPYIKSDLRRFDAAFGLPEPPSFRVATATYATTDANWSMETALDVQWAHAIAPGANLLLVQAGSDSLYDMLNAVDYARRQPGVSVVSMSWGAPEFIGQTRYDGVFHTPFGHAPVAFVAASGDFGAAGGVDWPASSPNVLAVGGTKLTLDASGNYVSESAWSGSGGGYSQFYSDISVHGDTITIGPRSVPDVSYAADPGSGFLVYNSVPDAKGRAGWFTVGGTSAGAPQWAGLVAIADEARAANNVAPIGNVRAAVSQMSSSAFNDVSTGSNGFAAAKGFDLATGVGSPKAASVIAQLTTEQTEKPPVFVGPIQVTTLTPAKRVAVTPPTKDVTQAILQAALAQDNAVRAALYVNSGVVQTPATVDTRGQDVNPPPVLVAPATSFGSTWDQSIRSGSGSAESQSATVPVLPGGADPGGPPAGAVNLSPSNTTTSSTRTASRKRADGSTARQSATVATNNEPGEEMAIGAESQAMIGVAAVFCFLGGCFVGTEPRSNEKKRPTIK